MTLNRLISLLQDIRDTTGDGTLPVYSEAEWEWEIDLVEYRSESKAGDTARLYHAGETLPQRITIV